MSSPPPTPADRIRELSAINADVGAMLSAAAHAVTALTNRPLTSPEDSDDSDIQMPDSGTADSLPARRAAFAAQSQAYYTHLQAVTARLRRQAYALEEAGIIAPLPPHLSGSASKKAQTLQQPTQQQRGVSLVATVAEPEGERLTNGGLGRFDVGWLNSRGNKVGVEKEAELVREARELVQGEVERARGKVEGD